MANIPKLGAAGAMLAMALAMGCDQTIDPQVTEADRSGQQLPLDMTPQGGNSTLGGAMRAAERTESRIADHQERLNRQMEGE